VIKPGKNWVFIAGGAGAMDAAARGLAVDLAPIRVNAVAPGVASLSLYLRLLISNVNARFRHLPMYVNDFRFLPAH
jgi:NAD(P)-dependent dehydrogenase (short-subunit alcohol dehydrogenase family)